MISLGITLCNVVIALGCLVVIPAALVVWAACKAGER